MDRRRSKKMSAAAALLGSRGGAARTQAKAQAARENGLRGGRPRSTAPRCPCGEMTLQRAKARGHKC